MVLRQQYVATGYVYDQSADAFLLILHKKLGKWLPPGGHLLEGEEPQTGMLRELVEETGLHGQVLNLLDIPDVNTQSVAQLASPFCILSELIPANSREEEHVHIDFVYAVEVDPMKTLDLSLDEASQSQWITGERINEVDTFENVRRICQAIRTLSKRRLARVNMI